MNKIKYPTTEEPEEPRKYKIIRFYKSGQHRTIKIVSSLEIAQLHCNDPHTKKEGVYFDGYTSI
jgi:hypothetical protein